MKYIESVKKEGKNPVILDAGDALFESSNTIMKQNLASSKFKAQSLVKGYEVIGYEAINVGAFDLAAGYEFLKTVSDGTSIPFLSANLFDKKSGERVFDPYIIVERPPFKIGIIGVTNLLPSSVTELTMKNYLQVGKSFIETLKREADIIVMLVNADKKERGIIKKEFAEADYIILSREIQRTRQNQAQGTGPFIYSPGKQGKYLAVIDLNIVNLDSPFVDVSYYKQQVKNTETRIERYKKKEPEKSFEEIYANQPNILRNIEVLRKQKQTAKDQLDRAINQSEYKLVSMSRKIGDDLDMLAFVDRVFKKENEIKGIPNLPPGKKLKSPIRSLKNN